MAGLRIEDYVDVDSIDGTELMLVSKSGNYRKTTIEEIRNLASDIANTEVADLVGKIASAQDVKNILNNISNNFENVNTQLSQKVNYYNTVSDMIADNKLSIGNIVITSGYYSENDGGKATYKVVNAGTGTANNREYINLSNGLQAKLITDLKFGNEYKLIANKYLNLPVVYYIQGGTISNGYAYFYDNHDDGNTANTLKKVSMTDGSIVASDIRDLGHANSMTIYNNKLYVLGTTNNNIYIYDISGTNLTYLTTIATPSGAVVYFSNNGTYFVFVTGNKVNFYTLNDTTYTWTFAYSYNKLLPIDRGAYQNCYIYKDYFMNLSFVGGDYCIISIYYLGDMSYVGDITIPTYGYEAEAISIVDNILYVFASTDNGGTLLATTLPNVIYNRISSFSNIYYPASCTNSYVNIYLSPTGSDVTGDGSATYPFKTIARALRLMKGVLLNSMDNIIYLNFADGDYSGNLNDYINFNGNIYIGKTGSGTVILPPLDIEGHCIITFTGNFTIKNNASNTTHLQSRSGAIVKSVDSITLTFVFTISGRGLYSTEGDINLGKIICDNTGGYSGITAIYKNGAGMISVSELNSIGTNITTCCYSKRGVIALATNTALYNSTYLTEGGGRVYTGAQSSSGAY